MKLIDIYKEHKVVYSDAVVFLGSGKFYITFNNDATLMSYLFKYKKVNSRVGFPINTKEKILAELENLKINCVFIDEVTEEKEFLDNQYFYYIKKSNDQKFVNDIASNLTKLINDKLEEDFSNYDKIKRYLSEL